MKVTTLHNLAKIWMGFLIFLLAGVGIALVLVLDGPTLFFLGCFAVGMMIIRITIWAFDELDIK